MRCLIVILIGLLLVGCLPTDTSPEVYSRAPSGQGHFAADDGTEYSVFRSLGAITYGQTRDAEIVAETLLGFTFAGSEGDVPELTLRVPRGGQYSMAVYGPRSADGLWGPPLTETHGETDLSIRDWALSSGGFYFVLLRVFTPGSASTRLSLACPNCSEPACGNTPVCDRYCPNGFDLDETECPECSCRGADCAQTGCAGNQVCVYPCDRVQCRAGQSCSDGACVDEACMVSCDANLVCVDGECLNRAFRCVEPQTLCDEDCPLIQAPVCGEINGSRRTFGNECRAHCASAADIEPGICPDQCGEMNLCPQGQSCVEGSCRLEACAACPQALPNNRVCGRDGRTYDSLCLLACRGETEVHYPGACLERCDGDCPLGDLCRPISDERVPGNRQACREDEQGVDCVRTCRRVPQCSVEEGRCDAQLDGLEMPRDASVRDRQHFGCYPLTPGSGLCVPKCDSAQENSCGRAVCAVIDHYDNGNVSTDGICLLPCNGDQGCPDRMRCLPDYQGQLVCQACACEAFPEMRICLDDGAYRNRCDALCRGIRPAELSAADTVEICDGEDNDCDGRIDEDLGPQPCNDASDCGEIQVCRNGQWSECEAPQSDMVEACDGVDNDCDGRTDELITRVCGSDVGQCRQGRQSCRDGMFSMCRGEVTPARETCNELDDDCDGRIDEAVMRSAEVCDRIDNDCDGQIDEDVMRSEEVCDRIDNDCDGRADEGLDAVPEVCNGRDDDCDGIIDEGNRLVRIGCVDMDDSDLCVAGEAVRALVRPCGSAIGECSRGHEVCVDGAWGQCIGQRGPQNEVCDGRDNDCDNQIDENEQADNPDAMACQPDCRDCPLVWQPACGTDGIIYESACRAECVTGQAPQALRSCLQQNADINLRCVNDQDCLRTGPREAMCAGERLPADIQLELGNFAACFSEFGSCECIQGQCGFSPTNNVERCIRANLPNGAPGSP